MDSCYIRACKIAQRVFSSSKLVTRKNYELEKLGFTQQYAVVILKSQSYDQLAQKYIENAHQRKLAFQNQPKRIVTRRSTAIEPSFNVQNAAQLIQRRQSMSLAKKVGNIPFRARGRKNLVRRTYKPIKLSVPVSSSMEIGLTPTRSDYQMASTSETNEIIADNTGGAIESPQLLIDLETDCTTSAPIIDPPANWIDELFGENEDDNLLAPVLEPIKMNEKKPMKPLPGLIKIRRQLNPISIQCIYLKTHQKLNVAWILLSAASAPLHRQKSRLMQVK